MKKRDPSFFRDPETGWWIQEHSHPVRCPRCGQTFSIRSGAYAKEAD